MSLFAWYMLGVVASSLLTVVVVMIDNELRVQGMTNRAMEALESTVKQTCYNAYKQGWAEGHEEGYTAGYTAGKLDAPDRNVSS